MAMTEITVTTSLATTEVIALDGVAKIKATGMGDSDFVEVYDESTTATEYDLVMVEDIPGSNKMIPLRLTKAKSTIRLEGYGNYKFVISTAGIEVGYVAATYGTPV
jgi:hypothetical protein